MPKWTDRPPVAPTGDRFVPPKSPPVVDITPPPSAPEPPSEPTATAPPRDPRTPATVKPPPEPKRYVETLRIHKEPAQDGIRYTVVNMGGVDTYLVVVRHKESGVAAAVTAKNMDGVIPITGLSKLRGQWESYLLINGDIAYKANFELDLTLEWVAESLGKATIQFGPTDGVLDRFGSVVVTPWGRNPTVTPSTEDFALMVSFPDAEEGIPAAKCVVQVLRPDKKGIYFRGEVDVSTSFSYRIKVKDYLPSVEPGTWSVVVTMGSKVLGTEEFVMGNPRRNAGAVTLRDDTPVEEFQARLFR